jgi:hypothetical protein
VDRHEPFDGFDFNSELIFNDDIHSIPAIEPNLLEAVLDGDKLCPRA